jgi:hypothetical protein
MGSGVGVVAGTTQMHCSSTWEFSRSRTAPAPCPRAMLRLALPSQDRDADTRAARPGAAGYVEVWAKPHDAEDYRLLIQVFGAPALPLKPVRPTLQQCGLANPAGH